MKDFEIIGWKEVVDFPKWHISGLVAKSDTGAKGSAIDVSRVTRLKGGKVSFDVVLHRNDRDFVQTLVAPISGVTRVRSSNGQTQQRYKVKTQLKIGHICKEIELSLVNRKGMICRVLLGRTALGSDFLVNSNEKYLFGKRRSPRVIKKKAKNS